MAPPPRRNDPARPRPLYLLVIGIVVFAGGGVLGLWLISQGKADTWLKALGVSTAGQAVYVRIVSWAGIVLGALCGWLLVRELRGRGRK